MIFRRWESLGRPLVFAHRGDSAHAKENTIEAFSLARDAGADGIEFDVRLTSDNVMIVHHNDQVRGYGVLRRRRFAELREELPWIPTVDEVLEVAGDMFLNAEIKNEPGEADHDPVHRTTRLIAEWAEQNDLTERLIVTSFNGETADQMRFTDRSIGTGWVFHAKDNPEDYFRLMADRGHAWLVVHKRALKRNGAAFVGAAHRYGMAVGVWTVNRSGALRSMNDYGVAFVVTDDPAKAQNVYA